MKMTDPGNDRISDSWLLLGFSPCFVLVRKNVNTILKMVSENINLEDIQIIESLFDKFISFQFKLKTGGYFLNNHDRDPPC